jgi:pilus assembly protein CpaB
VPFIYVIQAIQEIPRGTIIQPNAVSIVPIPDEFAPFQSYTASGPEDTAALALVVGLIARTDIFQEQIITTALVTEDFSNLSKYGSDAAAVLPANRVAVSVPISRLTSVAYAIQPGDRVDVITSFLFVDVDINFQSVEPNAIQGFNITADENGAVGVESSGEAVRANIETRVVPFGGQILEFPFLVLPSEQPRPRLATQRTIPDALVVWTGDFPEDGRIFQPPPPPTPTPLPEEQATPADGPPTATPKPPRPDIITLAVSPQDAVVLTWMVEAGIPVTFALRSSAATSLVQTETVSLDYIMTRFGIEVPEKFDFNIEPAIRSIRQLEVGERISLTQGE